jgi:predicted SAM-dependent methyltransferase
LFRPSILTTKPRLGLRVVARRVPVLGRFVEAAADSLDDIRRAQWRLARRSIFAAYFSAPGPHRLHLGAGRIRLPGWLDTDIDLNSAPSAAFLDASKHFPFADATFDRIFSEHMIEHLEHGTGARMLRECFRVLKPGGVIRVSTPDLAVLLRLYRPDLAEIERRYLSYIVRWSLPDAPPHPVFVINNNFRAWGHKFLYDERTLRDALERAGFIDVVKRNANESAWPDLRDIDAHGRAAGHEEMAAFESMALEALRP